MSTLPSKKPIYMTGPNDEQILVGWEYEGGASDDRLYASRSPSPTWRQTT